MSLLCVRASSQRIIEASPPTTIPPFAVGMWVRPTSLPSAIQTIFSVSDSTVDTRYLSMGITAANVWYIGAKSNILAESTVTVGTPVVGEWHYIVGRFISIANRRISVMDHLGGTAHAQETTSRTVIGLDTLSLGSREGLTPTAFFDGSIAEFWITNTDIQPDGQQLDDDLLRQLAYNGPFSVPHITQDLVEYRSLRKAGISDMDESREIYEDIRKAWTNTNAATISDHPPLSSLYIHPPVVDSKTVLLV